MWGHLKEHINEVSARTIKDFEAILPAAVTMVDVNTV
jgi:hypothetical protein